MQAKFVNRTEGGIDVFQLENDNGMCVELISFGARISRIVIPSKIGKIDVVVGFENPDDFMGDNPYFNAVIGRVGNRIGDARFELNGKQYTLFKNDGNNHLHGGKVGFDSRMWKGEICDGAVVMSRLSTDGEEGYPGNLQVSVKYTLSNDNELKIEYSAECDQDTICSLTNHAYFNLDGDFESVLDHIVEINADALTDVNEQLIPTGELKLVENTPYDFRVAKPIGQDIKQDDFLLNIARGYDFNFVLQKDCEVKATAFSKKSGVKLSVLTDRPCMQFYTGNFLEGLQGRKVYGYQSAFCMETQGYPNACNVKSFESMTLKCGEKYNTATVYKFEW